MVAARCCTFPTRYHIAVTGPGGVGRSAFTERFITDVMPTQVSSSLSLPLHEVGWELTSQWRVLSVFFFPPL